MPLSVGLLLSFSAGLLLPHFPAGLLIPLSAELLLPLSEGLLIDVQDKTVLFIYGINLPQAIQYIYMSCSTTETCPQIMLIEMEPLESRHSFVFDRSLLFIDLCFFPCFYRSCVFRS